MDPADQTVLNRIASICSVFDLRRRGENVGSPDAGTSHEAPAPDVRCGGGYLEKVKPAGSSFSLVSAGTNARSVIV